MTAAAEHQAPWLKRIPADITGDAGRAWRWQVTDEERSRPDAVATLDQWLLLAPGAHPWWAWHVMAGVDLAPHDGLPPAHKRYPEAQYELLVLALDPDQPVPQPLGLPRAGELHCLVPPDVVVQFHNVPGGREQARRLVELCALACVDGRLIPDSDHQGSWDRSLATTLQHAREGRHEL